MSTPLPAQLLPALYLLPVALGDGSWQAFAPPDTRSTAHALEHFVVENSKTARAMLHRYEHPRPLRELSLRELPRDPDNAALDDLLAPLNTGHPLGLMSDAGCPAVADPGARLVARAHETGRTVIPLVGPNSLLLALMGSGLNGQQFAFHGYLPIEAPARTAALRHLEQASRRHQRTQIFIETPYRNQKLFGAMLEILAPETRLCVASNLNTALASILTHRIDTWRRTTAPRLERQPTVFLMLG